MNSPCTRNCRLNSDGICTGCYRDIYEIRNWRNLNEQDRDEIREKIRLRAASMQGVRDESVRDD